MARGVRTLAFVVSNKQLPCDPEFLFTARVFGVNGQHTNITWDPPRYHLPSAIVNCLHH